MTTPTPIATDAAIEQHLDETADERLRSYMELLRMPSISALPQHFDDCRATAEWIAGELRRIGIENVSVEDTNGGHPVVYGDWLHAGDAPTVIVYGHYDVQPVDPVELWESPPFEPVAHDGSMYGRGTSDDKGQIHMHLRAAEALFKTRGGLPINVRYVFEGDEESKAQPLEDWIEVNHDRLDADLAIISDTGFFEGNLPAITISLRGMMYAQIDVTGSDVDLHSGGYGGAVDNPANALARIITALKGPDGRVLIPGFYDDVVALTDEERRLLNELPFDEEAYRAGIGVPALAGESGFGILERRGARPTLDVNGMWSGFQGAGSKTIIPAHAHAKVSCRLVTAQDPDRIFAALEAFVEDIAPPSVRVSVQRLGGGRPSLTPLDHPATRAAARSIETAFGQEPVYIREGGSIPVCSCFAQVLGLPVVLFGFTPPDDHAHAPNEWMDLQNYETGIRAIVRMWDELAAVDPADLSSGT